HNEHFVFEMAGGNEGRRRRKYIAPVIDHAAAIVDEQADCRRSIFGMKQLYSLLAIVLVEMELTFLQTRHWLAVVSKHRNIEHHLTGLIGSTPTVAVIAVLA